MGTSSNLPSHRPEYAGRSLETRHFALFQLPFAFFENLPKVSARSANNSVGRLNSKEKPEDAISRPI